MTEEKMPSIVTFTIDGHPFTTDDDNQTPGDLLALVGFTVADYDLAEVKGNGQVHKFQDSQTVHIKDGDEFVTVRREAPVA